MIQIKYLELFHMWHLKLLLKGMHTKKSDIYSFGIIMWEHTTGKKPFHDRPHDHYLMLDVINGERPQITSDTPKFYSKQKDVGIIIQKIGQQQVKSMMFLDDYYDL